MRNKFPMLSLGLILALVFFSVSCEDIYHPVSVKRVYEPAKDEDGIINIKSGESVYATFTMRQENNPDCVGYNFSVVEETEDNSFVLSPGEDYEVVKGNIVKRVLGTYVDAVPYGEGMEFSVCLNTLASGTHNLTFCVYASFKGNGGIGTFSSDYPESDRIVVVVE